MTRGVIHGESGLYAYVPAYGSRTLDSGADGVEVDAREGEVKAPLLFFQNKMTNRVIMEGRQ